MTVRREPEEVRRLTAAALGRLGYTDSDAACVADHLLEAELVGMPALGVRRLEQLEHYIATGGVASGAWTTVSESPVSIHLDAGGGIGYPAVEHALSVAREKCDRVGIGVSGVTNFYLNGALRVYAERLAKAGYVVILTSASAPAIIAAPGGRGPVLGTNPIAVGFPDADQPVVWDSGMTSLTWTELGQRAADGIPLEPGWAVDEEGEPTTAAQAARAGALLNWGGYRGFGLAVVVQLLGMMVGAPHAARGLGDCGFFGIVLRPDLFGSQDDLPERLGAFRTMIHASGKDPLGPGPRLPGEGSAAARRRSLVEGIELSDEGHALLTRLAPTHAGPQRAP